MHYTPCIINTMICGIIHVLIVALLHTTIYEFLYQVHTFQNEFYLGVTHALLYNFCIYDKVVCSNNWGVINVTFLNLDSTWICCLLSNCLCRLLHYLFIKYTSPFFFNINVILIKIKSIKKLINTMSSSIQYIQLIY